MVTQKIINKAKQIGNSYANKLLEERILSNGERTLLHKIISGSVVYGYLYLYNQTERESAKKSYPKIEPTKGEDALLFSKDNEVYVNLNLLTAWILEHGDEYGPDPCLGINSVDMVEDIEAFFTKRV